jgi:hypothetical protein
MFYLFDFIMGGLIRINKEKEKLSEAKQALASFQAQADKIRLL